MSEPKKDDTVKTYKLKTTKVTVTGRIEHKYQPIKRIRYKGIDEK